MEMSEIFELINNSAIDDETIYHIMKEKLIDQFDASNNIISPNPDELVELEQLSTLIAQTRPLVLERLRIEFLIEHGSNCPSCQKLKNHDD